MDDQFVQKLITKREARVPYVYQDSKGYWTIGIGHLVDHRLGGCLPDPIIDALFAHDLAEVKAELDINIPWWRQLDNIRQAVMVDLCFNMGWDNLSKFKFTLGYVKAGNWVAAAGGLRGSVYWKEFQKINNPRAEQNAYAFEHGAFPPDMIL